MMLKQLICLLFILHLTVFQFVFAQNPYPASPGIAAIDASGKMTQYYPTSWMPLDVEPMPNGGFCVTTMDGNLSIYNDAGTMQFQHRIHPAHDVDVIDENTFLLTSRSSKEIAIFQRGTLHTSVISLAFEGPSDTDSLPNGNWLVCDAQGQRVVEITTSGETVWEFSEGLRQPLDALRLSNGNTLISDFDNHRIIEVQPDGNINNDFRGFNHPQKIYPLNEYEFLVADSDNQRIVKLNLNGEKQVIQNQLNYVITAVFYPTQSVYLCSVQNRFSSPNTEAAAVVSQSYTSSTVSKFFNRYTLTFLAGLFGIVLWFNRSTAEWACIMFAAFYLILFGVGYLCITEAASKHPYQPAWLFYVVMILLAISTAGDIRKTLLPVSIWISAAKQFVFPLSWVSIGLLIVIPSAAMMTQYYHWVGMADGSKFPWYLPMLLWVSSVYAFFRSSIFFKKDEPQSPALFTTGSVSQEDDDSSEFATQQSNTILDSPEWQRFIHPALAVILLVSACLYAIDAVSIPTDVHGDEAEVALHGIEVRDSGNWNIFNPNWYLIPNLFFLIPSWVMWLFGDHLFGMRMAGAITGIVTVLMFYLFVRRLLLPFPTLIAVYLFAVSSLFVHFSRMGTGYNQAVFFTAAVFYFLLHGIQKQNARSIQLSGFTAGMGLLSYQAAQVLVPLSIVSIVAFLIWALCYTRARYPVLSNGLKITFLFGLGVWITFAPLFGSYLKDPSAMFSRTKAVSLLHEDGRRLMRYNFAATMTLEDIVKEQFRRTSFAPITYPDLSPYLKNNQFGGMLDPVPALLFSAGLIALVFLVWHPAVLLILLWYAVLLYPTAITNSAPAYQRLVCVLPILFIIAAPVLSAVISQAANRLCSFPHIKAILMIGMFLLILVLGMNRYFHQIMAVPQQLDDHTRVARYLRGTGPAVYTYLFGRDRFSIEYGTIRFLSPDSKGMDVENPESFIESTISKTGPVQFLFAGKDVSYAEKIKAKYPGGKMEYHYNMLGQTPFITYQINR